MTSLQTILQRLLVTSAQHEVNVGDGVLWVYLALL